MPSFWARLGGFGDALEGIGDALEGVGDALGGFGDAFGNSLGRTLEKPWKNLLKDQPGSTYAAKRLRLTFS